MFFLYFLQGNIHTSLHDSIGRQVNLNFVDDESAVCGQGHSGEVLVKSRNQNSADDAGDEVQQGDRKSADVGGNLSERHVLDAEVEVDGVVGFTGDGEVVDTQIGVHAEGEERHGDGGGVGVDSSDTESEVRDGESGVVVLEGNLGRTDEVDSEVEGTVGASLIGLGEKELEDLGGEFRFSLVEGAEFADLGQSVKESVGAGSGESESEIARGESSHLVVLLQQVRQESGRSLMMKVRRRKSKLLHLMLLSLDQRIKINRDLQNIVGDGRISSDFQG